MATHGRASEFGLLRRCDRWGVLEKGLVQAEIPRVSTDKILIKIEEYSVKKVVRLKHFYAEGGQISDFQYVDYRRMFTWPSKTSTRPS